MNKWIAEFELEDGDTMPEHMNLEYKGARLDFHCRPMWIPVTERLPDTDDEVLCWYEYYHWSQEKVLPDYGLGRYFKETSSWFGEVANGLKARVIAWQPLPEPYKEAECEKE